MGFEYGYSVARSEALVCWEAKFGDFADGAQTIIDEFIASGEAKWGQKSSLTLLLPHGYEGQGPDHSSARPERYLQLAAENNMTIAMCSTPANHFHLLRRQGLSPVRRPLIAFTPKSLLRLKPAVSQLDDFIDGTFQPVIGDTAAVAAAPEQVRRVLLCSGKVYYDLDAARAATSAPTSRSCGSSSSTRCRPPRSGPSSTATRTPSWCGCRKSPRTRARGRSSRCTCRPSWTDARCGSCRAGRRPRRRSGRTACTTPSSTS